MVEYDKYFIELPNNIIWSNVRGEISVTKYINNKTIMILSNLMFRRSCMGVYCFTLENLITKCGYAPKTGKGKINDQFKDILIQLQEFGFIVEYNVDMRDIKPNTFVECKIGLHESGDDDRHIGFFKLFYKDYVKIMNLDTDKGRDTILNSYCYISARMNYGLHNYRSLDEELNVEGLESGYAYFEYDSAVYDLGVTEITFKDSLNILSDNKLVSYDKLRFIRRGGLVKATRNNLYIVGDKELEDVLNNNTRFYTNRDTEDKIIEKRSKINLLDENGKDAERMKSIKNLKKAVRSSISWWRKYSVDKFKNTCLLTGVEGDIDVHHQYQLDNILRDVLDELNIGLKPRYTRDEITVIREKVNSIHKEGKIGICLNRDIHILFHIEYGKKNISEKELDDFIKRYFNGEFDNKLKYELKSINSIMNYEEVKKLASFCCT